ncbi:thiosulfate oxidation carrier complex protein SoxZ [Methylotenera versatilis]|uniref:thiosulfate oxidation carrier complex protein SoxZ n=1 Tax=Methylotenera versatilis TaxID=1055487 RepID=UPI00064837A2
MDNIKMRAKLINDTTEVKMIINHPMETGRKKDDFGQLIPAHFIQLLTAKLNGQPVIEMQWGTGISKNPYVTFYLKSAKVDDKIVVNWVDNLGKTGEGEVLVTAG